MLATALLNTEHGVFLTQLGVLRRAVVAGAPPAELRAVVATIAAPLHRHREAEELYLYPAIAAARDGACPELQGMEAEHTAIDRLLTAIETAPPETAALCEALAEALGSHIAREIHELFPLAQALLGSDALEAIGAECLEHYHRLAGVAARRPS